jgi:thiamine-monophosphate kinase
MKEFELIARLLPSLPTNPTVVAGAGDDCAVLDLGVPDKLILFKTDAVVEGIHFNRETPPEKIGRKALARCLSDIAAMAGTPVAAVVTIALPQEFDSGRIAGIYAGLNTLAAQFGVAVAGGETTTNPERILISIALLGTVERGKQTLRSGAMVGDAIFVTGELGGSLAGKHLDFEPRLAEARWLASHFAIHAMLDVSDGLAGDLRHILDAGRVGAEIWQSALPVSRAARGRKHAAPPVGLAESGLPSPPTQHPPAVLAALTDGEDFELLFTVASAEAVRLLDAWRKHFPCLSLNCIGKIVAGEGIRVRDKTGGHELQLRGYEHFRCRGES